MRTTEDVIALRKAVTRALEHSTNPEARTIMRGVIVDLDAVKMGYRARRDDVQSWLAGEDEYCLGDYLL